LSGANSRSVRQHGAAPAKAQGCRRRFSARLKHDRAAAQGRASASSYARTLKGLAPDQRSKSSCTSFNVGSQMRASNRVRICGWHGVPSTPRSNRPEPRASSDAWRELGCCRPQTNSIQS
jgi:hypothetical protein